MQAFSTSSARSLPAQPQSVAAAREVVGELAMIAGASPDQADAIRLAVSEAVTNAVVHGYRGASGEVQINAAVCDGVLAICIGDEGAGMHRRSERPGLGLGLGLIARLADEMQLVEGPAGGTEVRMRFALTGDEPVAMPDQARDTVAA